MKYGCMIATLSEDGALRAVVHTRASAPPQVVVDENGVAEAGLAEPIARVEHVGPATMPVHVWIRDHHRIPPVVGTSNPSQMIEPGPVHSIWRFGVANP